MGGVINQIRTWATELSYWEQAALDKIIGGDELRNQDYEDLVEVCLQDSGLRPAPAARPAADFASALPAGVAAPSCRLVRLLNLRNVNALPDGQEIDFGPQLTLIFGDNGAGKTGYARPLGSAAFARGEREVLPNATEANPTNPPQADIVISYGNETRTVSWISGNRCAELAGFYVFDSNSLTAHLTRSNPISFSPGGLAYLTRLAEVTDDVRRRIRTLIEQRDATHNFGPLFEGASEVAQRISELGAQTDLTELQRLGSLNEAELADIARLEREIGQLKSQDVAIHLMRRRQERDDLETLMIAIRNADESLGDSAVAENLVQTVATCREEVRASGIDQFRFHGSTQIGSDAWRDFVKAAKLLADAEATRGATYPGQGDHCLLCRQPLSAEAIDLINRLWDFVSSNAQARLEAAEEACAELVRQLESLDLNYFGHDLSARRLLEMDLPALIPALESHAAACSERRREILKSLGRWEVSAPPPAILIDVTDLRNLSASKQAEISELESSDVGERLNRLEASLRNLKHRRRLGERIKEIESYVEGRKWAALAKQSLGSTQQITKKFNDLFKELVTDRYVALFQKNLQLFKSDLRVTVQTRGQKGETVRQIILNPEAFPAKFAVERILSEGEKRAVAIADFLTEATLDKSCMGIIFDDPVTSLDNKWKRVLAKCLAEHAKVRQVVVFTHDLPFLSHITEHAEGFGVEFVSHWVVHKNGRPGFIYRDNSPVCESEYRTEKKASEWYAKAKDLPPAEQQSMLEQGFGALRTSYEALVIFELFGNVVGRFEERISFDRLRNVCVDRQLVSDIVDRAGALSRHIDAHLHSDAYASGKPAPEDLLREIKAFQEIRSRLKVLRKNQGTVSAESSPSPN